EPTSALDPTGAEDVLAAISRLVHDLGVTVVVAEHRIERVIHLADSIIEVTGDGTVRHDDPARIMADAAIAPPIVHLSRLLGLDPVPLSIRDARRAMRRVPLPAHASVADRGAVLAGPSVTGPRAIEAKGLIVR